MAYCSNCGFKIEKGISKCSECGKVSPSEIASHISGALDKATVFSEKALPQAEEHLRSESARFITPAIFGFAFLCLFFPFVNLAMFSLSGMNLVFGLDIGFGARIGGHWAGVFLFLMILGGIAISLWDKGSKHKIIIAFAALGLLFLLGLAIGINNYMSDQLGGFVQVSMGAGFYFLFLAFSVLVALNILFIKTKSR